MLLLVLSAQVLILNCCLRNRRILLQKNLQLFADYKINSSTSLTVTKLLFRLSFELWLLDLNTYDAVRPSRMSSPLKFGSLSLSSLFFLA